MNWIDATDIKTWSNRRDCQEKLPLLARKLIRASVDSITRIKFPAGDSILSGGWDGILEIDKGTEYIPVGKSVWEFGAGKDPKGKADDDYDKRTKNPLGFNPSETTFVFVSSRIWQNGKDWAEEKKKEGIWMDVKILNAEDLEEWLETVPSVSRWLARILPKPLLGTKSTNSFWEEWCAGPGALKLNSDLHIGGRSAEVKILNDVIKAKIPAIVPIQSTSRDEALAFCIASFVDSSELEEDFFSRSIIVENAETFRELVENKTPLIMFPMFDDDSVINHAVQKGHTVMVPLGADASENWPGKIKLPTIERDSFINALLKMGINKEIAEKYSKESIRNLSILRRQLKFSRNIPKWADMDYVRQIIPALLVGRWDENFDEDRNIVSKLAGVSYDSYINNLTPWLHSADPPIIKIGTTWRVASPLDAWANISKNITQNDFDLLRNSALEILSEINPALELPADKRYMASIYRKNRRYSNLLREGVTQSLILISIYGERLELQLNSKGNIWVDNVISELLQPSSPEFWLSIVDKLMLISEASPKAFLDAVERVLALEESPINALFVETQSFIFSPSYHTGLLWALENVAWSPDSLARVSIILAKLSAIDSKGTSNNRPANSLSSIYCSWLPQTNASAEERIEVIKLLLNEDKDVIWEFLLSLLPGSQEFSTSINRMRWRNFDNIYKKTITSEEIYQTYSAVIEILLDQFDNSEKQLAELISKSTSFSDSDRDKLFAKIEKSLDSIEQKNFKAWISLKNILGHHRSHPDTNWALPETVLVRYDELFKKLEPKDDFNKAAWLFNEFWPTFPSVSKYKIEEDEAHSEFVKNERIEALTPIYKNGGVKQVLELCNTIKEKWVLGETYAYLDPPNIEVVTFCNQLLIPENHNADFVNGLLFRLHIIKGQDWIQEIFAILKKNGFNEDKLGMVFVPLHQSLVLWNFIDTCEEKIRTTYWRNVVAIFWHIPVDEKIIGIKYLIEFKRFFSALDICGLQSELFPNELLIDVLKKVAMEKTDEDKPFNGHRANRILEDLDERKNVTKEIFITLELLYLPILTSQNTSRRPTVLYEELQKNAEFFNEVLSWVYLADDKEVQKAEIEGLSEEQVSNRANRGYELLENWNLVPGRTSEGKIDGDFLLKWIEQARELASKTGRLDQADMHIGKMFSLQKETDEDWPDDEICSIIEKINTDRLKKEFSVGLQNKRSSSVRGVFDGGKIERDHATFFKSLFDKLKNKYPNVAKIFHDLSKRYENHAVRMDDEAEATNLEY